MEAHKLAVFTREYSVAMIGPRLASMCMQMQNEDCLNTNSRLEGYLILLDGVGDSPNCIVKFIDCDAFSLVSLNNVQLWRNLENITN